MTHLFSHLDHCCSLFDLLMTVTGVTASKGINLSGASANKRIKAAGPPAPPGTPPVDTYTGPNDNRPLRSWGEHIRMML